MEECACNIILSLNIRGSIGLTQKENLDGPKPSVIMFLIFKVERNGLVSREVFKFYTTKHTMSTTTKYLSVPLYMYTAELAKPALMQLPNFGYFLKDFALFFFFFFNFLYSSPNS